MKRAELRNSKHQFQILIGSFEARIGSEMARLFLDDFIAGELLLAVESLCDYLHEIGIKVSAQECVSILKFAEAFGGNLQEKRYALLNTLVLE